MTRLMFILFLFNLVACGVKGPPEPPLPTEASLKKQLEKEKKKQTAEQSATGTPSTPSKNQ